MTDAEIVARIREILARNYIRTREDCYEVAEFSRHTSRTAVEILMVLADTLPSSEES